MENEITVGATGLNHNDICPLCGKAWDDEHKKNELKECLNNKSCGASRRCVKGYAGDGQKLAGRINVKSDKPISAQPMYAGLSSLAAHHLICSEALRTEEEVWKKVVHLSGYSINCYLNGVYLPMKLDQACHFRVPVHVGGHAAGYGGCAAAHYPEAVMNEIKSVLARYRQLNACEDKEILKEFVEKMNSASERIFAYVKNFVWTITWDGFDYEALNPIGCANEETIPAKQTKLKKKLEGMKDERVEEQNKVNSRIEGAVEVGMSPVEAIERTRERQKRIVDRLSEKWKNDENADKITCAEDRIHYGGKIHVLQIIK